MIQSSISNKSEVTAMFLAEIKNKPKVFGDDEGEKAIVRISRKALKVISKNRIESVE